MMTAPGRLIPQRLITLVANKLEAMRQTENSTAISRNVVENLSFIFAVFIVVPVTLENASRFLAAKIAKNSISPAACAKKLTKGRFVRAKPL